MSVNIAVNGRFEGRRITGVERYASEILRCLGTKVRVVKPRQRLRGLRGHLWEQFLLPALISRDGLLWSPANTGPLVLSKQVVTIQDLSPIEHPEWFRGDFAAWYRLFLPVLARRVRQVLVPSQYVRRRIEARFGLTNISVTSAGVDGAFFHPHALQNIYELPEKYILFVGSLRASQESGCIVKCLGHDKQRLHKYLADHRGGCRPGISECKFAIRHRAHPLSGIHSRGIFAWTVCRRDSFRAALP